jgi:hypothetical protein
LHAVDRVSAQEEDGCSGQESEVTTMKRLIPFVVAALCVVAASAAEAAPPEQRNFRAPLSGSEEVADPPVETNARGQATFKLSSDGTELHYRLIVANIENVTMAHIHLAPAGANGPVVAWLYPSEPPPQLIPGRTNGILATGVITAGDLVGLLAGASLDDLIGELRDGNAYVNVHTSQFPAGEVRGQIR